MGNLQAVLMVMFKKIKAVAGEKIKTFLGWRNSK